MQKCKRDHPVSSWVKKKNGKYRCADCHDIHSKKWRENLLSKDIKKQRKRERAKHLKAKFGMSLETFEAVLLAQDNKCAICKRDAQSLTKSLSVDHNHVTKAVRGLLCQPCNMALGLFQDSTTNIENALNYLRKYQ